MPSIRIGYSSEFVLRNELVGIGSTATSSRLDVAGQIRSENTAGSGGVSTFREYQGFSQVKANITNNITIDNGSGGPYGSLTGEIKITGETTVSSGSTVEVGKTKTLTVTDRFAVPLGETNNRDNAPEAGTTRFNQDFGTLEFFDGVNWKTVNSYNRGNAAGRALYYGGYSEPANVSTLAIDVVTISTLGNATRFGQMAGNSDTSFGIGNQTRGIYHRGGSSSNTLEYVSIASEGNPIDFGDLSQARYLGARGNSSTRGVFLSGSGPGGYKNNIDYVEMGTLGNALDFGDVNTAVFLNNNSVNSTVRVYSLGGYASPGVNISKVEYVTITSKGDALEFDDLDRPNSTFPGFANNVRGIYGGGNVRPETTAQIYMFNTASQGKMIYFGELTQRRKELAGSCSQTRGVFAGGQLDPNGPTTVNVMDYVTIMSAGNATDFGDLTKTPRNFTSLSDSHGGLGGF
jgi:hypothetical protein